MADEHPDRVSVPTLVMTGGPLDGTAYPLQFTGREVIVGSSLDADVQILLGNVESFHSRISFDGGALLLSDAGSATGTFVNGEKIENSHPLQEGDRICLGPPGAKGSAKLIVRMPGSTHSPLLFGDSEAPDLGGDEPAQGAEEEASLFLGSAGDSGLPATFSLPDDEEGVAAPLAIVEDDSSDGGDVVGSTPTEEDEDGSLFVSPLPTSLPAAEPGGVPEAPPAFASLDDEIPVPSFATDQEPALPAPRPVGPPKAASPPPPPARRPAEPPAPPPPPKPPAPRLTAPPPPPPSASATRPAYETDLPSIPVARSDEPGEPFAPLRQPARPAAKPARPAAVKRRPAARRRGLSLPLPIIGGALALVLVAGLAWMLRPRKVAPELVSITPTRIDAGQTVKLSGRHFAKDPADNTVLFGALPGKVRAASESELEVVVPPEAKAKLAVTVETKGGRSAPVAIEVLPVATASAVDPDVALPGESVLIHGEGVSERVAVRFAGLPAASVEEVTGGLKVVVPQIGLPEGSTTTVTVEASGQPPRSFPFIVGRLPLVLESSPARGVIGARIALKGRGFAPQPRANAVTIGGQPALVLSANPTTLTVVAPAPPPGDISPEFPIVVSAFGRASSGTTSFGYERGTASGFPLRFFPAPVTEYPAEDLAFVSSELGPALLLAGAAGAASSAERAAAVAEALNTAIAAAAQRRVSVELRERPAPGVALVGAPSPLLVATAADAQAYGKPWAGTASRRVAPAMLARHWTALLQDYIGLFVYRERPLHMLTLSAHGRVLSDIYGESSRRAPGGTNVPLSVVVPTPVSMAAALRQMALVVSSEGGRAAVALEGTWQGTIEDPDRGQRRFRIVMRTESSRLAGSITTWQRALELTSQLRDVAFERGSVRFTADLEGTANQFQGTVEGNTVSGTITRPKRDPARFTMQYAE